MKKWRRVCFIVVLVAVLFISMVSAHATLINRGTDINGNRLIYDSDLNITWYDYTRDKNTWDNQANWASALSIDFGGTIYGDWRLPTALEQNGSGPCFGYNCTGSRMGHLYYTELGNVGYPSAGYGLANKGDFQHLQSGLYWSGTEYATYFAWNFNTYNGNQSYNYKDSSGYALAVRPGDVSPVPEPDTLLLLGCGFAGLVGLRQKLKKA